MTPEAEPVVAARRAAWLAPVTYVDPRGFREVSAAPLLEDGADPAILPEPPFVPRRFLRYAPEFVDDPDNCGLFKDLAASVYGAPPAHVAVAYSAALVGYRTLIAHGHFFNDELYSPERLRAFLSRLSQRDPFLNEETGLRPHGGTDTFVLEQGEQRWRRFEGPVVVLCSTEPSNYGSFLFRVLPKVHAIRQLQLTDLPFLYWNISPATKKLLELAGIRVDRLIPHDCHTVTVLDQAIVPALRNPDAFLDYESRALLRCIRDKHGLPPGGRRLYVSRLSYGKRNAFGRVMQNEEQLIARLVSLGFEILEPENVPITQAIALLSSAEIVVGPSGSGMFNVVFCHPGTKIIDIESEDHWIYAHAGLFASCELRYGIFVGQVDKADPRSVHRSWTVNIDALADRAEKFLRG